MYSAPGSPLRTSLEPNKEAIPAATIPRGPTQLINSFSLVLSPDFRVLRKTPNGRNTKMITAIKIAVSQRKTTCSSSIFTLAESRMNNTEISNTLNDSLKYNNSLRLGRLLLPSTIPITTTASKPDSWAKISDSTKTSSTTDRTVTLSR